MNYELFERPKVDELYMIAGWRQWADGGNLSSGLPHYLVELLHARKIGHIKPDGFYLFQTPVSQFWFRPQVKFDQGYRVSMASQRNDFYFVELPGAKKRGLLIFIGDEPHMDIERYAETFFDVAQLLGVKRIIATGGVYAIVPFDKPRSISSSYSHKHLKQELMDYAVSFSNYEGGVSVGSYMNDRAEKVGVEYCVMYAFVPMYDLSQFSQRAQAISIEEDFRGWYEVTQRIDHMFKLGLDLSDLARKSEELTASIRDQVDEAIKKYPQAPIKDFLAKIDQEYEVEPFVPPLDDVWQDALNDLFDE